MVLLLISSAIASDTTFTEDKTSIALTKQESSFTLKLKSNPTTGYSWFLREYDSNLLTPLKHSFKPPSGKLIGAPGYELWTFRVKPAAFVVPQQTVIRMMYARPWQTDHATQVVFKISPP